MLEISKINSEILNKLKIENIISEYITINKKGNNFYALCPFHDDKNPSLIISIPKQIFKCFSCNTGGNLIIFVKLFNNLTYINTLELLAKKIGYEILNKNKKNIGNLKIDTLYKINNDALKYFQYNLMLQNNNKIRNYLFNERNLTLDNITLFKIGFSGEINNLYKYLLKSGYNISDIIDAGLANEVDGKIKDFFYNRIIFAITDENNNIIGFSGRNIDKSTKIKYINTKTNLIFSKGQKLYNVYNALLEIRKKQCIYIVEGYFDVISLYNKGIYNVLATMGTSLTTEQINILKKICTKIILFFDGDNAGTEANIKNSNMLLVNGFDVKIVNNKTEDDPDELILKKSKIFDFLAENTIDSIDYILQKINLNSYNDINMLIDFLKRIQKNMYKNTIKLSICEKKILNFLEKNAPNVYEHHVKANFYNKIIKINSKKTNKNYTNNNINNNSSNVYLALMYLFIKNKKYINDYIEKYISKILIINKNYQHLIKITNEFYIKKPKFSSIKNNFTENEFLKYLEQNDIHDKNLNSLINQLYNNFLIQDANETQLDEYYKDVILNLEAKKGVSNNA